MNNQVNLIYSALYRYTCLLNTPPGLPVFNSVYYEFTTHDTLMCQLYVFKAVHSSAVLPCVNKDMMMLVPWSSRLSKSHFPRPWDAARLVQDFKNARTNKLTV